MNVRNLMLASLPIMAVFSSSSWAARNCCPANGQADCNGNCVPDACDLSCWNSAGFCGKRGTIVFNLCYFGAATCGDSVDCNGNGVPDECDPDCDGDGVPDDCEADCDNDGVPDDCQSPRIIYVDASAAPGGDGVTWASALQSLQDALMGCAIRGDEIWIAGGTYYPGSLGDRSASFVLRGGVALYGGFNGTEPGTEAARDNRQLVCDGGAYSGKPCDDADDCPDGGTCTNVNPTILSGDLLNDDATAITNESTCTGCGGNWGEGICTINGEEITNICENSFHVVTYDVANASVILDGLTIRDGYANGTSALDNQGSGLQIRNENQCLAGGPTVSTCIFDDNWAEDHAAVNDHASSSSFTNCVFKNNRAAKGAGLLVDNGSPTIADCLFLENKTTAAPHEGGGAWFGNQSCDPTNSPTVTDSLFVRNVAMEGGGLWSTGASPSVGNTTFTSNRSTGSRCRQSCTLGISGPKDIDGMGGAVFLQDAGSATDFTNCMFTSNDAEDAGGAVFIRRSPSVTVEDCTFYDNVTFRGGWGHFNTFPMRFSGGGAIWNQESSTTIRGCLFDHNQAGALTQYGGAIYNQQSNGMALENCKFFGNRAGYIGGAVYEELSNSTHINCLYVGNAARPYSASRGGAIAITSGGPGFDGPSYIELINCTIAHNQVFNTADSVRTGGVHISGADNTVILTNCVLWGNRSGGSDIEEAQIGVVNATAIVTYSIWEGHDGLTPTIGNRNPLFRVTPYGGTDGWVDDPLTPGIDEGFNDNFAVFNATVWGVSPCIDAGDNTPFLELEVPYDLTGNPRLVDDPGRADTGDTTSGCPLTDLGAYELQTNRTECCGCNPGYVCCDYSCYTGDCCVNADCDTGEFCVGHACE